MHIMHEWKNKSLYNIDRTITLIGMSDLIYSADI